LLFERLENPIVLNRLVEDLYEDATTQDYSDCDYIDPEFLSQHNKYVSQDRYTILKDIRDKLSAKINLAKNSTEIHFSEFLFLGQPESN